MCQHQKIKLDGINFIAIQALEKRTAEQQQIIEQQQKELEAAKAQLQDLKTKMARFESALQKLELLAVSRASE